MAAATAKRMYVIIINVMLLIELPALQALYVCPFQNQGACSSRQPSIVFHFAIPLSSFLNHLLLPFHSGYRRCPQRLLQNHAPSCSRPRQNVAQRWWSVDLSFHRWSRVSFFVAYPSALSCRSLYHTPRLGNPPPPTTRRFYEVNPSPPCRASEPSCLRGCRLRRLRW